jgi:hypothetical protein
MTQCNKHNTLILNNINCDMVLRKSLIDANADAIGPPEHNDQGFLHLIWINPGEQEWQKQT